MLPGRRCRCPSEATDLLNLQQLQALCRVLNAGGRAGRVQRWRWVAGLLRWDCCLHHLQACDLSAR